MLANQYGHAQLLDLATVRGGKILCLNPDFKIHYPHKNLVDRVSAYLNDLRAALKPDPSQHSS